MKEYKSSELAECAGVTKRTIHYYVSRGLIPPPEGTGVGTKYTDVHLARLLLIKRMQEKFLPLDEILRRITDMTHKEVIEALDNKDIDDSERKEIIGANRSTVYRRINLGYGIELHFPDEAENGKMLNAVYEIAEYAKNFINNK